MQDDGNKLRISLLCANDQRIESNGGIAGLASDYIGTVLIRPVFLDHFVAGGNSLAFRVLLIGRQLIVCSCHYF